MHTVPVSRGDSIHNHHMSTLRRGWRWSLQAGNLWFGWTYDPYSASRSLGGDSIHNKYMSTFRRGWRWSPLQGNLWFVEDNLSSRKPMHTVPELSHDLNVEHMMLELLVLNSWLNSTLTFVCRWNEWSFTSDKCRFCLYSQIFLASFQSFSLIGLYRIASVVDAHQFSSFGNQIPWFQVHSWSSRKVLISVFRFICTELIKAYSLRKNGFSLSTTTKRFVLFCLYLFFSFIGFVYIHCPWQ